MTCGPSGFLLGFVLTCCLHWPFLTICPHSASVEVLIPQLLCLAAVWLSGFFFLPLFDYSLIMGRSFYSFYTYSFYLWQTNVTELCLPFFIMLLKKWGIRYILLWQYQWLCDCKWDYLPIKGDPFCHFVDKLEGKYSFGGSDRLCNCLLDVVCNLQIITLLRKRF